jgi:hypothetical protein
MLRGVQVFLMSCSFAAAAPGADSAGVLARAKGVSGGDRWDVARSWRGDGTLTGGGLSGEYHATVDLVTGRSADSYQLGPVDGADGYDGKQAWAKDPGGEVAALDAPEALRRARSQAWLDARAYWFPQRGAATYAPVAARELDGKRYDVVEARPQDAEPVVLWFAADSGLLARVVQREGQDTAATAFDDYREVSGLRLPFHVVTDKTDAAGRTDPRRRSEVRFERIALDVAIADADFAMPQMAATAHIDSADGSARIPFELINNHIFVDATINGRPARLIVDTAGANILTPAAAAKFGVNGAGKLSAAGNGEERTDFAFANIDDLRVGAARMDHPVFYIVDLGQLADVEGVPLDGLVGYELFRRFGTTIDYARREFTLTDARKFTPPPGASAIAFDLDDHVPIVAATLGGLPARITIDTGSRSSLTLHSPFVRANQLVAAYHAAPESVTGWGIGGAVRGRMARLPTLQIGDQRIDGIAGELFTGDKGAFANPDISANLGSGVLRRFTVAFDYDQRKMYLAPKADFARPDAFDRSGLWLLRDGEVLRVTDVVPDSAAARAGLRVDDRIVAIGGEAVAKRSLAQWRQLLRESPVGTRVVVRYRRGSDEHTVDLVLADRIPATAFNTIPTQPSP